MKYRKINGGVLKVSAITLGTMTFGSPVGFDDSVELIHQAMDVGINLIDTANMYEGYNRFAGSAGGVAEEIVGRAAEGCRDKLLIATKLGMKVGNAPEDQGTSAAAIHKQLPQSLARLRTDYVDIYYLHCHDASADLAETLLTLESYRINGAIRCYGVSNYTLEQLRRLVETADRLGIPRPAICQPALSLLKPDALLDLIPYCRHNGIAVTPYQVLQGGLLTGKYRRGMPSPKHSRHSEKPDWLPSMDDALFDKLDRFQAAADARNLSMTQYAIQWTLCQPGVATTIVGVKNHQQILDAVEAADIIE